MLSAVISSERGQPAMPLAGQLAHQRFVHLGPLVLETGPLKTLSRVEDRDRTVSRRSEPSSRTALMGEQPNPWDLLQPQDATSRHCRCRITSSDFRPCSTRRSRSQAPLCTYTQHLITNQAEGTFERLRYFLGGNRPS